MAWVNCVLSIIKYLISLIIMCVYRDDLVNSCRRSGFVGFDNSEVPLSQAVLTDNSYYTPVQYPGTLNAHATSTEQCQSMVQTFLICFGVIIFVVELIQVTIIMCTLYLQDPPFSFVYLHHIDLLCKGGHQLRFSSTKRCTPSSIARSTNQRL